MKTIYMYRGFERFWHWTQAVLILLLGLTGFEIHGTYQLFGYQQAVVYHNAAAIALVMLIALAVFWHFTTGEWRQYVPTRQFLRAHAEYYITGIFRAEPHPTRKTAASKLNPLQKIVYLGLKLTVIPVMVISGALYMFHRYPQRHGEALIGSHGLETVALLHTAGAFFLVAFVVGHLYLTTTGETPVSNLKAMLTGHEDVRTDHEEAVPNVTIIPETAKGQA